MKTLRRMLVVLPLVLAMNCKPNPPITTSTGQNHSPSASLVIDPLSGEAPLTTNISLTGTDEDGDTITYSIKIDDNSDGTIDYIKEELSPIQIERTFNAGKATIYGKCSDPDGLRSELEQEVMISRPTPENVLPTSTFSVSPTSGQYPLLVDISLEGEDSDGQITEYKLEINVQDGKTDAKDEIIKQSTLINLSRIFEPGNVMIYGTVTDDKGGKVIKGESIQVSERNDLVGEIAFAEGGYAVGDDFLFSGTIRNNTNTDILIDNANKDSLEYKLIRQGNATPSLDIKFEEDATITSSSSHHHHPSGSSSEDSSDETESTDTTSKEGEKEEKTKPEEKKNTFTSFLTGAVTGIGDFVSSGAGIISLLTLLIAVVGLTVIVKLRR